MPQYGAFVDLPGRVTARKHFVSVGPYRSTIMDHLTFVGPGINKYPIYYPYMLYVDEPALAVRTMEQGNAHWLETEWVAAYDATIHIDGPTHYMREGMWVKLATPTTVNVKAGNAVHLLHKPYSRVYQVEPRSPLAQDGLLLKRNRPEWVVNTEVGLPNAPTGSTTSTGETVQTAPPPPPAGATRGAPEPQPTTSTPPPSVVERKAMAHGPLRLRMLQFWDGKYPQENVVRTGGGTRYRMR